MSLIVKIFDKTMKKTEEAFSSLAEYQPRETLLAEVIRSEQLNLRAGTAHSKNRGEISGGGKKPWRQKGTGRARHGSTRSPIWIGGGVVFGPRNTRNWHRKINKSARVAALKSILKDRLTAEVVYKLPAQVDFSKTQTAAEAVSKLTTATDTKARQTVLVYSAENKESLRGFKNTDVVLLNVDNLKIMTLANSKNLVLTPEAQAKLEAKIAK